MRVPGTDFELTYCLNVHPGESLDDILRALRTFVLPLKARMAPGKPFGLGLRVANRASHELLEEGAGESLRDFLGEHDLYALTVNGFPFGDFHTGRVKEHVYQPDWTQKERLEYTLRLAKILAALLPENTHASISTCPIAYAGPHRSQATREELMQVAAISLAELADALRRLHERTGRHITVDMEPEPDGILESSVGVVEFFAGPLQRAGRKAGLDAETLRRYLGVCYDTCHFAVLFERPENALAGLRKAGINIGKMQLSSALSVPSSGVAPELVARALEPFADSIYLHQTVGRLAGGELLRFADLHQAIPVIGEHSRVEWRTHFHVPVFIESYGLLGSTRDILVDSLRVAKETKVTRILEIETYTWDVLPAEYRGDLQRSLEREYKFALGELGAGAQGD